MLSFNLAALKRALFQLALSGRHDRVEIIRIRQLRVIFMQAFRSALREHIHFVVVITVLTLVMTFPTILYVLRTDVFWHPASGSHDVYIKLWDIWYGGQTLSGQADRFYTDLLYFPEGVSLVNHPMNLPYIIAVNILAGFMPVSNAVSLMYMLIIIACGACAYIFLNALIQDKWIALLGAITFAFSPHVIDHRSWPDAAFIATIPLVMHFYRRGIEERQAKYVVLAGLVVGLVSQIKLYHYVCILIMLAFFTGYFALARWRDATFWRHTLLLIAVVAFASAWRLLPMLQHSAALSEAIAYYTQGEQNRDLFDFFFGNPRKSILGKHLHSLLQLVDDGSNGNYLYLGVIPLGLTVIGIVNSETRRKMLPWLFICLVFLVLSLGSTFIMNGREYENVLLPKYFLNNLLPFVFGAFSKTEHFMAGARLPLAVLACFGMVALGRGIARRRWFVCLLIALVALDYYIPVKHGPVFPIGNGTISKDRLAFVDWLAQEDDQEIRLINLPMGRTNAKFYLFYQSLHGYPQTEGAISRTPESAYDYIRAHYLLSSWHSNKPVACAPENRDNYLAALSQLENDGFSHVLHFRDLYNWRAVDDSFDRAKPSHRDDFTSIYRLDDLRASCP